ncbi:MAG TPA: hypothetical protein VK034_05355 [Enhygromyxa sp.]|nr:hypothetical protein [Enhygromyxa sp.]
MKRLVEVPHQRGIPAGEVLRGSESAQVCERLQCRRVATCKLDNSCQRRAGHRARAGSGRGLSRDHASTKLVTQLPPAGLVILRPGLLLETILATAIDPRHRFDGGEQVVSVDVGVRLRAGVVEQGPKVVEPLNLDIHTIPVGPQNIQDRNAVIREDPTDLRERQAEVAQRTDAIEASRVVVVIEALVTLGP